jgi:hypothetical protein
MEIQYFLESFASSVFSLSTLLLCAIAITTTDYTAKQRYLAHMTGREKDKTCYITKTQYTNKYGYTCA